jgi:hypothetical protein
MFLAVLQDRIKQHRFREGQVEVVSIGIAGQAPGLMAGFGARGAVLEVSSPINAIGEK